MYIGEEGGYTSRPIEPGASQDDGLLEAVRGLVARFIRTSRGAGGRGATRAPPPQRGNVPKLRQYRRFDEALPACSGTCMFFITSLDVMIGTPLEIFTTADKR